jgi:beta-mannanase
MSAHEEVEEHVHHAQNPFDKIVAGSMAIIAALLAVVSVLGQHFNTEELLLQQKASDQWAFSQAKDIRRYSAQIEMDTLAAVKGDSGSVKKYADDSSKYKQQHDQIQEQARDYEEERDQSARKANRFHLGEIFLEVAIVLSSLSILMKARPLFFGGAAAAFIGIVISITAEWA